MRVLLCGAGSVGTNIAEYLGSEYTITLVDRNPAALALAAEKLDVQTVLGESSDPETLKRAQTDRADIFIAVTDSNETNIVASQMAHTVFGVKLKIARLSNFGRDNNGWTEVYKKEHLPVDIIISPEQEITDEILKRLSVPFATSVLSFFEGQAMVISLKIAPKSPLTLSPIKHLDTIFGPLNVLPIKVTRDKTSFIPQAHDVLEENDVVFFLVPSQNLSAFSKAAGYHGQAIQRALILGGGDIGLLLATEIEKRFPHISCILVETRNSKIKQLLGNLQNTIILRGDGLDPDILEEAGVKFMDTVITLTNDDTINILGALLAKRLGAKRSTTLVLRQSYLPLIHSLGIDNPINPSALMISKILQHVRRTYVDAIYSLGSGIFDTILQISLPIDSPVAGETVANIQNPKELIVLAVLKGADMHIDQENVTLEADDALLVMCNKNNIHKIQSLFVSNSG